MCFKNLPRFRYWLTQITIEILCKKWYAIVDSKTSMKVNIKRRMYILGHSLVKNVMTKFTKCCYVSRDWRVKLSSNVVLLLLKQYFKNSFSTNTKKIFVINSAKSQILSCIIPKVSYTQANGKSIFFLL